MKLKRIVAIRIITTLIIILLVVVSLILAWYKRITNSMQIIGVGVTVISFLSYIYYSIIEGNLEEIDYKLNKMYKPLRRTIILSQKKLRTKELSLIDSANDIETFIRGIEIESIYDLDDMVMKLKKGFVGSPSENNLSTFLDAVEERIIILKKERKKYEY